MVRFDVETSRFLVLKFLKIILEKKMKSFSRNGRFPTMCNCFEVNQKLPCHSSFLSVFN